MNKIKNILNWVLGMLLCSLGVCMCTKAGFGLSMIGAPPYILHVWLRDSFSWFSQGTGEYVWEALILLVVVIIIRRFKIRYLLSFLVAVVLGVLIDAWFLLLGGNAVFDSMAVRITCFCIGLMLSGFAVACYFRTTMPLQVYELAVIEVSDRYKFNKNKVKWVSDILYLVLAVGMSLLLNGSLTGIGVGTVIITFINAPLISLAGRVIDYIEKNSAMS